MIIFFLVFAIVVAFALQKVFPSKGIDAVEGDHWPDRRVVDPDEMFHIEVVLRNRSRRFVPFLRVREPLREEFVLHDGVERSKDDRRGGYSAYFTTWLRPRQQVKRALPVSVERRGRYMLMQLSIYGGDFLGIDERLSTHGSDARGKEGQRKLYGQFSEIVVAPRPIEMGRLDEQFGGFLGEVSVNRFIMEDPVLTLGYREYTGREPMKMISWAQSARGSGLMVKKYDYTLEPSVTVMLNIDTTRENREELIERCYSIARTVCEKLERSGTKYDFVTNALIGGDFSTVSEGLGVRHLQNVLEQLGRATYANGLSAQALVEKESRRVGAAAGRIFITPAQEPELAHALSRLREIAGGSVLVLSAEEVGAC